MPAGSRSAPRARGPRTWLAAHWPLRYLVVAGDSMLPTLAPGDWILAVRTSRAAPGRVVVALRPDRPVLVVKRVARVVDTPAGAPGYWLVGDNPPVSTDSRAFGPVVTLDSRVVWRIRPFGPVPGPPTR